MTPIPQVDGVPYVNNAEFVVWLQYDNDANTVTTYTFSSSYKDEQFAVDGTLYTFEATGALLQIGTQQRDITATSFDTTVALAGVDPDSMFAVVNRWTKGSEIKILRGFYDENYRLEGIPVLRYSGIITSWDATEDYTGLDNTVTLVLSCASTKTLLQQQISGRKTNGESWRQFSPDDRSMDRVATLSQVQFDFGKKA